MFLIWKKLLCKVEFTLLKSKFFPPNFPFPKYKRKIWREKILCKRVNSTLQMSEVRGKSAKNISA
jgi:hypothetical protein